MVVVDLILVVMLMAIDTTEHREITSNGMAFDTLVPLLLMLPGIDRKVEIVVVEGRRNPGSFTVT